MLRFGYLVGQSVFTTAAYTTAIVSEFVTKSELVFHSIAELLDSGELEEALVDDVIKQGFVRLTG